MSRKRNCWDNAVAEAFFSSLKKERINKQIYQNMSWRSPRWLTISIPSTIERGTTVISEDLVRSNSKRLTNPIDGVSTKSWELQKPDFSGEWQLNRQASMLSPIVAPVRADRYAADRAQGAQFQVSNGDRA
jgi:transposase InsO family protein